MLLEYIPFYGPGQQIVSVPEGTEFLSAVLFGGGIRVYFRRGGGPYHEQRLTVISDYNSAPIGGRHLASLADPNTTSIGPYHVFIGGQ